MSRIMKSIINTVLKSDNNDYILFHCNSNKDIDIIKQISGRPLSFEPNQADLNKLITKIVDAELSNDLTLQPKFIVNTNLGRYESVKQLSILLRVPIFNIIYEVNNLKKEGLFSAAAELDKDINIVFSGQTATKLYLTNYNIVSNISQIKDLVEEGYKTWKPE